MTGTRIVTAPGVRPVMQVAVGDVDVPVGQAVYDTARYDTYPAATYAGLEPAWMDDSCDVIQATTFYGRERAVDQFDVGTATLRVANPDGLWDFPPTSDLTPISLRPGRQLRVGVITDTDVAYQPGYLNATVGNVVTPDPGLLPTDFCLVWQVAHTAATGNQSTGRQIESNDPIAWYQYRTPGALLTLETTATGHWVDRATRSVGGPNIRVGTVETLALGVRLNESGQQRLTAYDRSAAGVWSAVSNVLTGAATVVADTASDLRVGQGIQGRLYWAEMRTGNHPAGGTVVWRFDADEYPAAGATSFTDPRGRTWTLTAPGAIVAQVPASAATPEWLWHGWVDATAPGYDPAVGDVVDVSCICAKGEAGRADAARLDAPVGDAETVTARMGRYADVSNFPAHRRQFDTSGVTLIGTSMGSRVGALMDRSAHSAGGDVFGDQSGTLVYRSQDWQTRGPGTVADGVIGNRGLPGEVCPNVWEVLYNRSDFTHRVNYGQSGGPVATVDDGSGGVETYAMTDLETVDAATRTFLAQRILRVRSFALAPRIAAVTLDAARPGVADLLAAADPFAPSMYSCGHVTDDGRPVFARTMYLTGIEHTIEAGSWTARLALDDAAPWLTNSNARYDAAHYNTDTYAKAV